LFGEIKLWVKPVDWSGRHEDSSKNAKAFLSCGANSRKYIQSPAGAAGQVRPRWSLGDEGDHRMPREPLVPGAEINHPLFRNNKIYENNLFLLSMRK